MIYKLDKNCHAVYTLNYHLIFCVKYRNKIFMNEKIIERAKELMKNIASKFDVEIINQELDKEHIHILFKAKPQTNLVKLINSLKGASARTLFIEFPEIKKKYPTSEVYEFSEYVAEVNPSIQAHHILPASTYPKFANYVENLISLSVGQHISYAHQGNTHWTNPDFQIVCLLSKLKDIKNSLDDGESFYDLAKFREILNDGLSLNISLSDDVETIKNKLLERRKIV